MQDKKKAKPAKTFFGKGLAHRLRVSRCRAGRDRLTHSGSANNAFSAARPVGFFIQFQKIPGLVAPPSLVFPAFTRLETRRRDPDRGKGPCRAFDECKLAMAVVDREIHALVSWGNRAVFRRGAAVSPVEAFESPGKRRTTSKGGYLASPHRTHV